MAARREAKARGEYKQDEFVYVDFNGNFTDTPPDPEEWQYTYIRDNISKISDFICSNKLS